VFSETYNDKITGAIRRTRTSRPTRRRSSTHRPVDTARLHRGLDRGGVKAKKVVRVVGTTDYGVGAAGAWKGGARQGGRQS
jgi:hypothetical protein